MNRASKWSVTGLFSILTPWSLTESHSQRLTEARQEEQMSDADWASGNREWRGLRQTARAHSVKGQCSSLPAVVVMWVSGPRMARSPSFPKETRSPDFPVNLPLNKSQSVPNRTHLRLGPAHKFISLQPLLWALVVEMEPRGVSFPVTLPSVFPQASSTTSS